jgi:hypothetical protein
MQIASQIFPFFEIPNWAASDGGGAHNWFSGGIDFGVSA